MDEILVDDFNFEYGDGLGCLRPEAFEGRIEHIWE